MSLATGEPVRPVRPTGRPAERPPRPGRRPPAAPAAPRAADADPGVRGRGTGAGRGARATRDWAGRPSGRMVLPGVLMAAARGVAIAGGALLPRATGRRPAAAGRNSPTCRRPAPSARAARRARTRPVRCCRATAPARRARRRRAVSRPADTLAAWAAPMAVAHRHPARSRCEAYALAELRVAQTSPACGLRWTTLAGIGQIESNHGRSSGATLTTDGRSIPPIYGPPLDGTERPQAHPDTDDGRLDGDSTLGPGDRPDAVHPVDVARYAVDADGRRLGRPARHRRRRAGGGQLPVRGRPQPGHRRRAGGRRSWRTTTSRRTPQNVFNAANDYGVRSRG